MTPCDFPLWLELVKALSAPIVAGIIGVATLVVSFGQKSISSEQKRIAQQQKDVAEAKLKLELFEERLAIFLATWEAASSPLQSSEPRFAPPQFTNLFPKASFLFGAEVEKYMRFEVASRMSTLATIRMKTAQNSGIVPPDDLVVLAELEGWFVDAATSGVRAVFAPYLDMSKWR